MNVTVYHIMHVLSLFAMAAVTFTAFANPKPEWRKRINIGSGVLALLVLVGGFGLLARLKYGWPGWVIVKVVCWVVLSAMAGMAYRKPEKKSLWIGLTALSIATAIVMVYIRPF